MKKLMLITGITFILAAIGYSSPPDLTDKVPVYVVDGPFDNGIIIGQPEIEKGGTITLTALPLSGTRSLWNAPLRYGMNGEVIATRTFTFDKWFCSGGVFLEGTNTNIAIWQAPEVEKEATFTISCLIKEGTVTIGRPFSFTYGPRQVSVQRVIKVVPPIPHRVEIRPGSLTIAVEGSQTFVGEVSNKQGKIIPLRPERYEWSIITTIGTLSQVLGTETIFSAGTQAGQGVVSLRIKGTPLIGTVPVTVIPGPPARVEIIPSTKTVFTNGTASFQARVYDFHSNIIDIPGNWSLEPEEMGQVFPIIGTTTLFTAGQEEGTVTIKIQVNGLEAIGTITIHIRTVPVLKYIIPTPSTITAVVTGSATVEVRGYDQYWNFIEVEYYDWELIGIEGTITSVATNTILIQFGTKSSIGTLTVSAQANATTTVTTSIPIILKSDDCVKVFFKPTIQELHIGPAGNSSVGTFTEGTITFYFLDKYDNNVFRNGTWTVYFNFDRDPVFPTEEVGIISFPTTTHPYPGQRIFYIQPGDLPVDIPVRIDAKAYGGPFYIRLSLFTRPYDPANP